MNQKGEVNLLFVFCVFAMSGLMILLSLELRTSLNLLKKRKNLFLCAKETQGEHNRYLVFMGRTNWGIKNASRVAMITMLIPGLQGVSSSADKVKKYLQSYQNFTLASYLKTLSSLKRKACPIDPRMLITPFELGLTGYQRDSEGLARLRKKRWEYLFIDRPYMLSMSFTDEGLNSVKPRFRIRTTENEVMSRFLSLSH